MAALRDVLDVDGFEVESISRVEYGAAEWRSCPSVLVLLCASRGRHEHSNATKLTENGLCVFEFRRLRYAWSTEINDCRVPRSAPRPFDWLAVVRRAAPDEHNDADRATDDGRTGRPPSRASR